MSVIPLKTCDEFVAGDGCMLRETLHPDKQNLALRYSLAHATVPPGATTLAHRLGTSEVYFIIQGKGHMHIDKEVSDVGPNDTIYIPPHATQYISNTGQEDLTFICIVDPAWRKEDEEVLEVKNEK
jgi:mannose-6-phosphate isomerase-like protein (cupin superfamily)